MEVSAFRSGEGRFVAHRQANDLLRMEESIDTKVELQQSVAVPGDAVDATAAAAAAGGASEPTSAPTHQEFLFGDLHPVP